MSTYTKPEAVIKAASAHDFKKKKEMAAVLVGNDEGSRRGRGEGRDQATSGMFQFQAGDTQ